MSNHDSLIPIDVTASTLEQAIHEGLDRLGLSRNDVIIEIIEEGSRGVLGMGARDAVVRLTPLRPPTNPVETAAPSVEPVPPVEEEEEAPEPEAVEPEVIVEEPEEEEAVEEEPAEEAHPGTQRELPPWAVPSSDRRDPEYRTAPEPEYRTAPEPEPEPEYRTAPEPEPVDEPEYDEEEEGYEDEYQSEEDEGEEKYVPSRMEVPSEDVEYEAKIARAALVELLEHMEVDADVDLYHAKPAPHEDDAPWILDVRGNDLGILIGRHGETLNALQYITRLIVSRELQRRANIVVDVEGYKARREDSLRKLAERMAEKAIQSGRTVTLDPMPPNERRVIHVVLRSDSRVETESVGSGDSRRVTIIPSGSNSSH